MQFPSVYKKTHTHRHTPHIPDRYKKDNIDKIGNAFGLYLAFNIYMKNRLNIKLCEQAFKFMHAP